ncbi:MAG: hypothetical protein FWH41_06230 [Treponema sp.]|nr:hypothetical protein [Treponema sp.]
MKFKVLKLYVSAVIVLFFGCTPNNAKNIPENVLFTFNNNGENNFIIEIKKADMFNPVNNNIFIYYEVISGSYPKFYNKFMVYLHVVPENDIFRFETMLAGFYIFEDNAVKAHADTDGEWVNSGYSNDTDNLCTKIFEYYLNLPH